MIFSGIAMASVPMELMFQQVVRNSTGQIQVQRAVKIEVSIIAGSLGGEIEYVETHNVTTNLDGLASIKIGKGTPSPNNNFADLDFSKNHYFLRCKVDLNGGNNFILLTTMQLMTVPYANHVHTTDSVKTPFRNSYANVVNKGNVDENSSDDLLLTGNQQIAGTKTFTQPVKVIAPVSANDAIRLQNLQSEEIKILLHILKLQRQKLNK